MKTIRIWMLLVMVTSGIGGAVFGADTRILRISLKSQSGTASELTLTGGTVTLNRSVPEGVRKVLCSILAMATLEHKWFEQIV